MTAPQAVPGLPPRTLSSLYLAAIVDILDRMGMPREDSLSALGLSEATLADPRTRVAEARVRDMFARAEAMTGNPVVGLETGFRFRVARLAENGTVLSHCGTFREAAAINTRYEALAETSGTSSLAGEDTDAPALRWTPAFDDAEAGRHVTELILGGMATMVRWLGWSMEGAIPAVRVRHARPAGGDGVEATYRKVFQVLPEFAAAHNEIVFPPGSLDTPLPTHAPDRLAAQCAELDRIMERVGGVDALAGMRATLADALPGGAPTRAEFAARLELTDTALRRRLERAGVSYRELLEGVRRARFAELSGQGAALAAIAHDLGYNDQSALTRAHRRWHGTTPGRALGR